MFKRTAILLAGTVLLLAGVVQAERFEEGTHYRTLDQPQSTVDEERIEVREFFSYACPFCHQFYPTMRRYMDRAPDDVVVVHHPVVFRADWEVLARAYLVADYLDIVEDVHGAVFVAYHEENQRLRSVEDAQVLFGRYADVNADEVADAWDSFGVQTALNRYQRHAQAVGVSATPSLTVNGKYYVDGRMAGSLDNLLQIVDYLVDRERQAAQ